MKQTIETSGLSRRHALMGFAGVGAAAALSACTTSGAKPAGSAGSTGAAASGAQKFTAKDYAPLKGAKVGIVGINLQGPTVAKAVAVMEGLGKEHDFSVQAVSADFDLLRVNDTMRIWADKGFDAIVIANTEAKNIGDGLKAAASKKIPVGGFYCGVEDGMAFDVQGNEFISGNRCATYIRQRLASMGGDKGIAVFGYTPLSNLRERELCIKTQAEYYDIPILFRHEVDASQSVVDIQNRTGDLLTKYKRDGKLGAIFVGWDQGGFAAVSTLVAAGRDDIFVVSIDGEEANLNSIREGGPQGATVVNDMPAVSEVVLTELAKIVGGAKPPATKELFVDAPLVTSANVPSSGIPGGTGLTPYYVA